MAALYRGLKSGAILHIAARNEVPRLFLRRRPGRRARLRAARFLASYDSRIRGVDVAGLRRLQPPKRTGAGMVVRGRPLHPGAELDRDRLHLSVGDARLARLDRRGARLALPRRSEEHTSELQSLMRISYAVFCSKKKKQTV